MTLHLAPGLDLPDDAVTETFAMLAKRGAGKSNAAVVMAEQMFDAGLPWVAIDPKGDWWGIRSSGDGKGAGLPVLILGGEHADVPLEPTAGRVVADLLVAERLTAVVDVSQISKADERRFLTDLAERLYKANTEPLHIFAEEAHEYIPQRVTAGDARMVGAWERLVKWGRTHGLGVTLITQRSASLNKDVLTQVETLIALRTTGPQDQAAIRAWVDEHESGAAMLAQLRKLANGEAYVLSPQWLELAEPLRVTFARRRTFDSGATPKAGQARTMPKTLAEVDLAALKEAMAETIERANADDPALLRKRIRDLERALVEERARPQPEPVVQRVEVPVLSNVDHHEIASLTGHMVGLHTSLGGLIERIEKATQSPQQERNSGPSPVRRSAPDAIHPDARPVARGRQVAPTSQGRSPAGKRETRPAPAGDTRLLSKAERAILSVLAQHGTRNTTQVALLTAYSHKSGGYRNALSSLRSAGYIEGRGDITATNEGLAALGDYDPLPTGRALLDWWKESPRLGKAEKSILDVLAEEDGPVSVDAIAERTGYSSTSGGFRNALSRLRSLELASGRGELELAESLR